MTILLNPLSGIAPVRKELAIASETGKSSGVQASSASQEPGAEDPTAAQVQNTPESAANVTFRRDASGRIYYVLTDAQSGKELQELPPEEVRKVGEGIADYIKREAARKAPQLNVKG
jgi:uncharacterized FlaG/YvyC family protein